MIARFLPLLNGRWAIEIATDDKDPIDAGFIAALRTQTLSVRVVRGALLVESDAAELPK